MKSTHCRMCQKPLPAGSPRLGRPIRYCNVECRMAGLKKHPPRPRDRTIEQAKRVMALVASHGYDAALERFGLKVLANAKRTMRRAGVTP